MWSPKGQQVMIPTPAQPKKRYGIGAVDYHTGETVVLIRRRKRRREIARKGGASVPSEKRSFAKDRDLAASAGRKGGEASRGGGRTKNLES